MNRVVLGITALLLVSLGAAFIQNSDPLAEFRNDEGGITIPGGKFTPELQKLLFPPAPADHYYTTSMDRHSTYSTISFVTESHSISRPEKIVRSDSPRVKPSDLLNDLLKPVADGFKWFFSFDWLFGRAAAVNRFAVFDDAQCTSTTVVADADCWSTTTNGDGDGAPVAGDDLVFDNGSGATSGTMEANLDITTGTIVFCSAAATPDADC